MQNLMTFFQSIGVNLVDILTVVDIIVGTLIVYFDEYVVKKAICKEDEQKKKVWQLFPLVAIPLYVIAALILKHDIVNNALHGALTAACSMAYYDLFLKNGKEKGKIAAEEYAEDMKKKMKGEN